MGIEENIVPGKILYLNVCFPHEDMPHNKYMIVAGTGNYPAFLKINSLRQQSQIAKKHKEMQFMIRTSDYLFLNHDSFLDCGTVWTNLLSIQEVVTQLTSDPSRIKGDILECHKNEIVRLTNKSRSIENRYKKIISDNFRIY